MHSEDDPLSHVALSTSQMAEVLQYRWANINRNLETILEDEEEEEASDEPMVEEDFAEEVLRGKIHGIVLRLAKRNISLEFRLWIC